jgi:hypothetical protein
MPLFEIAIISVLTKKEAEDGVAGEKLLFGPKFVMAKDGQTAAITLVMSADGPRDIDMAKAQVLVRPFA